jgi:hypothetical protein
MLLRDPIIVDDRDPVGYLGGRAMGNTTSWQFIRVTCPRCNQVHLSRVGLLRRTDPEALETKQKLCPICQSIVNPPQKPPREPEPTMTLSEVFKRWKGER